MKQSDITPKIIDLSKRIAEHWRMEIYEGCWYVLKNSSILGCWFSWGDRAYTDEIVLIPSIEDVLEKLDDLGFMWNFQRTDKGDYQFHIYPLPTWVVPKYRKNYFETKDKHETVLLALLEVLRKTGGRK